MTKNDFTTVRADHVPLSPTSRKSGKGKRERPSDTEESIGGKRKKDA